MNHASQEKILVHPNDLEYDIFHSILLSHYIKYWGRPSFKKSIIKDRNIPISAYCFENSINNKEIMYFSTIGLSFQEKINNTFQKQEFFIVLPKQEVKDVNIILNYLLDICVHLVNHCDYQIPPSLLKSFITPNSWKLDWLLIDEPLGEPEDFLELPELFEFKPDILWIIPIDISEANYIKEKGIEAFEIFCRDQSIELINPNREVNISI